jgi:hypothetical protein
MWLELAHDALVVTPYALLAAWAAGKAFDRWWPR